MTFQTGYKTYRKYKAFRFTLDHVSLIGKHGEITFAELITS